MDRLVILTVSGKSAHPRFEGGMLGGWKGARASDNRHRSSSMPPGSASAT